VADWRVNPESDSNLLKLTRIVIEEKDPGTIVYQILDNSGYYSTYEGFPRKSFFYF
jgi:hypothetical protein